MAFCQSSAWIEQQENLQSKLLLMLPCSREHLLHHSHVLHRDNVVSPNQNVTKSQGRVG